jgi:peptidoglycan/LPS O-acetylase OafA/YrhL
MESPLKHIPELDGLRGIAITLVMVFHLVYRSGLAAATFGNSIFGRFGNIGWCGVDLFFVLSGFLIGGILIDNRDVQHYFRTFYIRRTLRIVPIYLAVLLTYTAFVHFTGRSLFGEIAPWYIYATFTMDFWTTLRASTPSTVFLSIAWSLAIEEQFYLTFPFIVRFVPRQHLAKAVAALAFTCSAARVIAAYAHQANATHAYRLPWFRADALLIGVLCALAVRNLRVREFLERRPMFLYGSAALCIAALLPMQFDFFGLPSSAMATFGLTLLPILFASVLLIAVLHPKSPIAEALRFPPLMYLGTVAYFVYLVHLSVPLLIALAAPARMNTIEGAWFLIIISAASTIVLASLSWRFFEGPFVRLGKQACYGTSIGLDASVNWDSPEVSRGDGTVRVGAPAAADGV